VEIRRLHAGYAARNIARHLKKKYTVYVYFLKTHRSRLY
jgi:hypothetical protein